MIKDRSMGDESNMALSAENAELQYSNEEADFMKIKISEDQPSTSIAVPVRRTYISDVPEDLRCPICFDSAVSCQTTCNHYFCFTCINSHINNRLRQKQLVTCPICRTVISAQSLSNLKGKQLARVRELRVRCVGMISGCSGIGLLETMERHESTCSHVLVFCKFREKGCTTPLIRKEAKLHESRCRFNPRVRCCRNHLSGCKVRGCNTLLKSHESKCKYRNMEKFVPCVHQSTAGCGLMIKKKYRKKHAECCAFKILSDFGKYHYEDISSSQSSSEGIISDESQLSEYQKKKMDLRKLRVSLQWVNAEIRYSHEMLLNHISKFLPNVERIGEGRFHGELNVILNNMPSEATRAIGMATDPQMSCNLKQLNLQLRGITTVQQGMEH